MIHRCHSLATFCGDVHFGDSQRSRNYNLLIAHISTNNQESISFIVTTFRRNGAVVREVTWAEVSCCYWKVIAGEWL